METRGGTASGSMLAARPLILFVLAVGLVTVVPAPTAAAPPRPGIALAAPPGATVEVIPSTDLVDFQQVRVTGSGFGDHTLLEVFQCRGGAVTAEDCDGNNAFFIDVHGAGGSFDDTFFVDARIWLPSGVPVDCRTAAEGCEIGVGFLVDAGEWPEAPLHFDPEAPLKPVVSAAVTPSTGLHEDQSVRVHGENLSPREEGFAYLCAPGTGMPGTRCDLDRLVRGVPDPDGSIDLELAVRSRFTAPLGPQVDCAMASGGCEIVVSWSFSGPPDRQAAVPISFAPQQTTTTSTPTTSTTSTSTSATSAPLSGETARPAVPVQGVADFTG